MVKKSLHISLILVGLLFLCSCSNTQANNKVLAQNNVKNVIDSQIETNDKQNSTNSGMDENSTYNEPVKNGNDQKVELKLNNTNNIDVDLTQMGSDMVYATVYQMMVNPDSYVGKTVKMNGNYTSSWYDKTKKYYHFVIIKDAAACCAQGIEFIWEDGNHVYPDEYPMDGADVEVTGVFETYKEEGDSSLYCRLKDASLIQE